MAFDFATGLGANFLTWFGTFGFLSPRGLTEGTGLAVLGLMPTPIWGGFFIMICFILGDCLKTVGLLAAELLFGSMFGFCETLSGFWDAFGIDLASLEVVTF